MSSGAYTQLSQLERERRTPVGQMHEVQRLLREQRKMQAQIDARRQQPPRMYSRAVGHTSSSSSRTGNSNALSNPPVWTQLTHHGFGPRTFSRVIERPKKRSSASSSGM